MRKACMLWRGNGKAVMPALAVGTYRGPASSKPVSRFIRVHWLEEITPTSRWTEGLSCRPQAEAIWRRRFFNSGVLLEEEVPDDL